MRRGFDNLSAQVQTVLERQPFSGHVFVLVIIPLTDYADVTAVTATVRLEIYRMDLVTLIWGRPTRIKGGPFFVRNATQLRP